MLNTAITQQLEGVKKGLANLQESIAGIEEVKTEYVGVEESLVGVPGLVGKLHETQEENKKHIQLRTAMKNIKSIIQIPDTISQTQKFIEDGKLLMVGKCQVIHRYIFKTPFKAHEKVTEMEMIKDEVLMEINKSGNSNSADRELCKEFFHGVQEVGRNLEEQLCNIIIIIIIINELQG